MVQADVDYKRCSGDSCKTAGGSVMFNKAGCERNGCAGEGSRHDRSDVMLTLAFETSCDETSASVVDEDLNVLSNVVSSQIDIHKRFGGVVPEVASRNHLLAIETVTTEALKRAGVGIDQIGQIAATTQPGLVGAVMVGRVFAEAMATARGIPFVEVNHIVGHIASCVLSNPELQRSFLSAGKRRSLAAPFFALVVSGGHTAIYHVKSRNVIELVASTLDDACGEAFDKVARVLGLPYPGGPEISRLAEQFKGWDSDKVEKGTDGKVFGRRISGACKCANALAQEAGLIFMPNANYAKTLDFSYSGLKTAVLNYVNRQRLLGKELNLPEICFAFQREAIGQIVEKCKFLSQVWGKLPLAVCGGVSANKYFREQFPDAFFPEASLCGDNAAMIGAAAILFDKELVVR